jgi:hypothetical protein
MINNRDGSLQDHNSVTLLRRSPRQLRMDQLFCPPLAITFPEFELCINGDTFLFESVTVGFKVAAWEQFVNFFLRDSPPSSDAPPSETLVELQIKNATIFYQPLDIEERKIEALIIAPPRAVLSVNNFYVS